MHKQCIPYAFWIHCTLFLYIVCVCKNSAAYLYLSVQGIFLDKR